MNPKLNFRGPSSIETASISDDKSPVKAVANSRDKGIQRTVANAEKEEQQANGIGASQPAVQRKFEESEETVQRKKSKGSGGFVSPSVQSGIASSKGRGNPIESGTRKMMSARFGTDFSGVRVHTNKQANQMAANVNARAFTVGQDIYFNRGEYQPETKNGKHLLAHELTHVVQQTPEVRRQMTKDDEISSASEEQISRWSVSGNTATVDQSGDTLAGLASSITGNWKDWQCIWVDNMKNQTKSWSPEYHKYIQKGDKFNVKNLKATTGVSATIVFNGADQYLQAVQAIYGGTNAANPFIDQLEGLSNSGDTPIQNLTLVGHSGATSMWGDNASFQPASHSAELAVPDGFLANNNQGPKRCWFTRNATVRFVGCSSERVAKLTADNLLRKGATATGTNAWICGWNQTAPVVQSMVSVEGPPCNWPPTATTYLTPAGFAGAAGVWVTHNGKK